MTDAVNLHNWLSMAMSIQADVDRVGLGPSRTTPHSSHIQAQSPLNHFDQMITSQEIARASRDLFVDGHYSSAVENAFKCLNNAVKEKSGLSQADGDSLMREAFSAKSPILKFNSFQSQSDVSEQRGYMQIFAGVMAGIRNPRAHEHEIVDDPEVALEMLIIANHLMRKLEDSTSADPDDIK